LSTRVTFRLCGLLMTSPPGGRKGKRKRKGKEEKNKGENRGPVMGRRPLHSCHGRVPDAIPDHALGEEKRGGREGGGRLKRERHDQSVGAGDETVPV